MVISLKPLTSPLGNRDAPSSVGSQITNLSDAATSSIMNIEDESHVRCQECTFTAKTGHLLDKHFADRHPHKNQGFRIIFAADNELKIYKCTHCNYKTDRNRNLRKHEKLHGKVAVHRCELCPFTTRFEKLLSYHYKFHKRQPENKQYKLRCEHCAYATDHMHRMKSHSRVHQDNKQLQCSLCAFRCKHETSPNRHLKRHDTVHHISCFLCTFKAKHEMVMTTHVRVHHQLVRKFSCVKCAYVNTSKQLIEKHSLKQTQKYLEERLFQCSQCEFRAKGLSQLKLHKYRQHPRARLYQCRKCPFSTGIAQVWLSHNRYHCPDFNCDKCSYVTKSNWILQRHYLTHLKEKGVKCLNCDHRSKTRLQML